MRFLGYFLPLTLLLHQLAWGDGKVYPGEFIVTRKLSALKDPKTPGGKRLRKTPRMELLAYPSESSPHHRPRPTSYSSAADLCPEILRKDKTVLTCSPNYERRASLVPNDTFYSYLWAADNPNDRDMDLVEAWDISTGSSSVVIAVVDTGILYTHPDLSPNVWVNPGEIAGNNIDDDGNGVIDDVHGYNAIADSGDPLDDESHGSHVSGTIGAKGNNNLGVTGVNWDVQIVGVKFLDDTGSGTVFDEVAALDYVRDLKVNHGIPIVAVNASYGDSASAPTELAAIQDLRAAGILMMAAAGNDSLNNDSHPSYPANYSVDNVISVAALNDTGALAYFSNYGQNTVDIGAPGEDILSTVIGGYSFYSGTSMATPHVTGLAALIYSENGSLTYSELRDRIFQTADIYPNLSSKIAGGKVANAYNALANVVPTPFPTPPPPPPTPTPFPTAIPTPTPSPTPVPTATPDPDPVFDLAVGAGKFGTGRSVVTGKQIYIGIQRKGSFPDPAFLGLRLGKKDCGSPVEISTESQLIHLKTRIKGVTRGIRANFFTKNANGKTTAVASIKLLPKPALLQSSKLPVKKICNSFYSTLTPQ